MNRLDFARPYRGTQNAVAYRMVALHIDSELYLLQQPTTEGETKGRCLTAVLGLRDIVPKGADWIFAARL